MPLPAFPAWAATQEPRHPRWVWDDTQRWYPLLLEAGVRIERCVDLRMCRLLLRNAVASRETAIGRAARDTWDERATAAGETGATLFDLEEQAPDPDPVAELKLQRDSIAESTAPWTVFSCALPPPAVICCTRLVASSAPATTW